MSETVPVSSLGDDGRHVGDGDGDRLVVGVAGVVLDGGP